MERGQTVNLLFRPTWFDSKDSHQFLIKRSYKMAFKQYTHLERFGNTEVEGIELGVCYIFPKIDGTNASAWMELFGSHGEREHIGLCGGSRTRELSLGSDNAGFYNWLTGKREDALAVGNFLTKYPHLRLYGEWLVPHTFKGYRPDAWHKFYVFDVYNDETEQYLSYEAYQPLLEEFQVEYIAPIAIVKNGDYERFLNYVANNFFLCPDGGEPGEGIVLKNYDYQNKFGRQAFAKIVRQEFKEANHKVFGAPEINTGLMNEERIVARAVSVHLVDKTLDKIRTEPDGWSSRSIPRLLDSVFYDVVREELWDCLKEKEINFGTVNFKTLKALTIRKVKELKPEVFS